MSITMHTDGSCQTQTKIGGWSAILSCGDHRRELSGSAADTTVNAMELTAAINGLSALKRAHQMVTLFTDSQYVARGITEWLPDWIERGWQTARNKPVANRVLWQQLKGLLEQHTVTVTWIPREQNAAADALAQEARRTHGYIPVGKLTTVKHLLIAGSRDATTEMLDYTRRVVRRAHEQGYTILVGDNPRGVDRAVVQECRRLQAKVVVAGIAPRPRNGGVRHGEYIKVARDLYRGGKGQLFAAYHARDRYLVDMADIGIFVWDGVSRGTKAGHDYMVARGKDAHLREF